MRKPSVNEIQTEKIRFLRRMTRDCPSCKFLEKENELYYICSKIPMLKDQILTPYDHLVGGAKRPRKGCLFAEKKEVEHEI